jgi:RimJ/RimL family protein N-acetyltransferase
MRFVAPETLTTERLVLRPYRRDDEPAFVALVVDPEVMRFVGDGVMTDERARRVFARVFELYERGAWGVWAVEETASGGVVGSAEIKPRPTGDWEIVYLLAPPAWGKGYATELGRALVRFGLERLGLPRVAATVDEANEASVRVLGKLRMRRIGEESDEDGPYAVYAVDRESGTGLPGDTP